MDYQTRYMDMDTWIAIEKALLHQLKMMSERIDELELLISKQSISNAQWNEFNARTQK